MTDRRLRLFPPLLPPNGPEVDIGERGSRRRLVLTAALITVATEISVLLGTTPLIEVGGLELSMSLIPALALGAACGDRLFGRSSLRRIAASYWIGTTALIVVLLALYLVYESFAVFAAYVLSALGEELVYRLAASAVFGVALMYAGVNGRRARLAGLALAGTWFVFLPGHQSQMTSGAGPIPFIAFALFSASLVYRSGSILPMAMAHAIVNLVTALVWNDMLTADARAMSATAVLGLLTLAYGVQRRVTEDGDGRMLDTVTGLPVVEVTEVEGLPVARLSDGTEIPMEDR